MLLSEKYRPPTEIEKKLAIKIASKEKEKFSIINILVEKNTLDIKAKTNNGDKFHIFKQTGIVHITKANNNKFKVKNNKRVKAKK